MDGLLNLTEETKMLLNGLVPIMQGAIRQAVAELVPAVGQQMIAAIEAANGDITKSFTLMEILIRNLLPDVEAAGARLIDHAVDRINGARLEAAIVFPVGSKPQ